MVSNLSHDFHVKRVTRFIVDMARVFKVEELSRALLSGFTTRLQAVKARTR